MPGRLVTPWLLLTTANIAVAAVVAAMDIVVVPVNVFLTGVPPGANMTDDEREAFEEVLRDVLAPRLATVDVEVYDVATASQEPNPDDVPESNFGAPGATLRVSTEVTIGYRPPPPAVVRDWSIYLKSWIQASGTTMVEILADPEQPQRPEIDSAFWDGLVDVSATSVAPPATDPTDPTGAPTAAPTFLIYPDNSRKTGIIAGVAVGAVLFAVGAFGAWCWLRFRRERRLLGELAEDGGALASSSVLVLSDAPVKSDGDPDGAEEGLVHDSGEHREIERKKRRKKERKKERKILDEGSHHETNGGPGSSGGEVKLGAETSRQNENRQEERKRQRKKEGKKARSKQGFDHALAEEPLKKEDEEDSHVHSGGDSENSNIKRERQQERKREQRKQRKKERKRKEKGEEIGD